MPFTQGVIDVIHNAWIDSTRAPLYVWTFPEEATDDELEASCRAREAWAARVSYPVAWVVDLSRTKKVTAAQRRVVGAHLKHFSECDRLYNQGSAIVVPNPLVRGVVTAVFWLSPPDFPHRLFASRPEAEQWATERLAARATSAA